MSVIDKKNKILNKIAAKRAVVDDKINDFKNKKKAKALESFNNKKGKVMEFITDLITVLVGYLAIVTLLVETFTHYMDRIEKEIKKAIKLELKNIVSCGVNPSLPDFLKSSGSGITIKVSKIDFSDLFKTDPNSSNGKLMYQDVTIDPTKSSDLNTFLYGVIQNDGIKYTWKTKSGGDLITITFYSLGNATRPNNSFVINAAPNYDNKKLTDLNNDLIDSIKLFDTKGIINRLVDMIYGSISFSIKKSKKQLIKEAEINAVIDKLIDADSNDIINDNYFTFDNDETFDQEREATLREQGIRILDLANPINASVPVFLLDDFNTQMSLPNLTKIDEQAIIADNLIKMANATTDNNLPIAGIPPLGGLPGTIGIPSIPNLPISNLPDNVTIKLDFASELFKNLTKVIVSSIISPKVIIVFLISLKIVYGATIEYTDGVDFIKKNKNIFLGIIKGISTIIIGILLKIALKEISKLVSKAIIKRRAEKAKQRRNQMATLSVGSALTKTLDDLKVDSI